MNESLNHSTNTRLRTSYNPTEYWIQQGRTYKDKFNYNKEFRLQEKMLLAYLKSISPKFRSVLEVGCGFGRITKLIVSNHPDIQRYVAVDLSPDQILNAEQYVNPELTRIKQTVTVSPSQYLISSHWISVTNLI